MNFEQYLETVPSEISKQSKARQEHMLLNHINIYEREGEFPSLDNCKICLLGVPEDRNANDNIGTSEGPNEIRKALYRLKSGWGAHLHITDIGNLKRGYTIRDTYAGLRTLLTELQAHDITCILLGGSQDLTYAAYKAYQEMGRVVNIVTVDSVFDLGSEDNEINNKSYLHRIILDQPNSLFNYTNMGYQTYYVDQDEIRLMEKLHFDTYRLGTIRGKRRKYEPLIRNGDIMSFDISSVKMADAPGSASAGPNGFDGVDACQICRYAGISSKISTFGIFEYNPSLDLRDQTAQLIAQMIWYFLEGFSQRSNDDPLKYPENYQKFYVKLTDDNEDFAEELLFYKNIYSGSWWMEVKISSNEPIDKTSPYLIPCSEKDFERSKNNHIPERWFQFYKKLI